MSFSKPSLFIILLSCGTLSLVAQEESAFKEYIVKEDIYSIVAESEMETALIPNSNFFPKRRVSTLVDYCEKIGGIPEYDKNYDTNKEIKPINCSVPNKNGFIATFSRINRGNNGKYVVVIIKHEQQQAHGYAMKAYNEENKIAKKSLVDFNSAMLDFGTEFLNYYGACVNKGGTYLISNAQTQNQAVDGSEYLVKGSHHGKSVYEYGTHWCVNTQNKNDEFTVNVSAHPFNGVMRFQPKLGIENMKEKYSDPLPWYSNSARQNSAQSDKTSSSSGTIEKVNLSTGVIEKITLSSPNTAQANQSVAMSRTPNAEEGGLAEKSINSRSNTLGRVNGRVLEAIYLGRNERGCDLAAVTKQTDQPYGHKYAYGRNDGSEAIMGYRRCNGQTEFIGESFEKKFPVAIENEYNHVLGMCKLRGAGMGSYLGYNIDCQRLGAMNEPVYETLIVKQDKLVVRVLEK